MTLLHDAYTALLSGLTHRTGNEIHWHDERSKPITVEPIDVDAETYAVRYFYEDGDLYIETHYLQDQFHGKDTCWYENGQLQWDTDFVNGKLHGKSLGWHHNGQLQWETDYVNGLRHGKCIMWYANGHLHCKIDYNKGKTHGKSMAWYDDGTLVCELYYINGCRVTREKWERYSDSTT